MYFFGGVWLLSHSIIIMRLIHIVLKIYTRILCYSKCGPQTIASITWEFVNNAKNLGPQLGPTKSEMYFNKASR